MLCHMCHDQLRDISKKAYHCPQCKIFFCVKCRKGHPDHQLEKYREPVKAKEDMTHAEKKEYLERLMDEYYKLDFEDIIGGGTV